jgi:SAM-dependent methyltransferase
MSVVDEVNEKKNIEDAHETHYGRTYADVYDALYETRDNLNLVTSVLREYAGNAGMALEFGIGTGRVALPLTTTGVHVFGIDDSPAMLGKLRRKRGADAIKTIRSSFVHGTIDGMLGQFDLVFCVFSTLFLVLNQADQVRTFENAARHLRSGGTFVVEGFVHDRRRFQNDQEVVTTHVATDLVELRTARLDAVQQRIDVNHVLMSPQGLQFFPSQLRFIHPSEMDMMARFAGFALHARWEGWDRKPFHASSASQIVIYKKV